MSAGGIYAYQQRKEGESLFLASALRPFHIDDVRFDGFGDKIGLAPGSELVPLSAAAAKPSSGTTESHMPGSLFGKDDMEPPLSVPASASDALENARPSDRPGSASDRVLSRYAISDAVAHASPAIVSIIFEQVGLWASTVSGGSGFIIDQDGTVVTNAHVVAGAFPEGLNVVLPDGRSFRAKVLSQDEWSDIALVKILGSSSDAPQSAPQSPFEGGLESPEFSNGSASSAAARDGESDAAESSVGQLPTVRLGDSSKVRVGEFVVAVGSPLSLSNTVTHGIVSAVDRKGAELGMTGRSTTFIQTDAAINQGNSGGPLLNLDGEVVAINSMKAAGVAGISFAIPINRARDVVDQLRKFGKVMRPFLGIKMVTLTPSVRSYLGRISSKSSSGTASAAPRVPDHGVFVAGVMERGPAHKAGLRENDVIVAINGKEVRDAQDVLNAVENAGHGAGVAAASAGTKSSRSLERSVSDLELAVQRGDKVLTLHVRPKHTDQPLSW